MKVIGKTNIGMIRSSNQDAFNTGTFDENTAWAVVCDGMGGANGGDVASSMAVDIISNKIKTGYSPKMQSSSIKTLLVSAINLANLRIFDKSVDEPSFYGMGTTAVIAFVRDDELFVAHAGDSRAYTISEHKIEQITTDHSVVQEMIKRGEISAEQAKNHPIKNYITRALGVSDKIEVDITSSEFSNDDVVLLCSDGLTNFVENEEIKNIIEEDIDLSVDKLINLANKNGGKDNITVVVVKH